MGREAGEIMDQNDVYPDIIETLFSLPEVGRPLIRNAKATLAKIERMLYAAPSFANIVKARVPQDMLQAVLTQGQKSKIAEGALRLMTKKDGSLMADLVNPQTGRVVSKISLESVKITPEIANAMTSYATQMQLAQIAEQIQLIQIAVEEVRKGQEYDRLATAYSCQQKLLQAMVVNNPELKAMALLRIAYDAEDSRNLLMQSQKVNLSIIKNEPESYLGKFVSGAKPEKINERMNEIRENLCAVNMVSLVEAMAYLEMGERDAARQSLQYYADYIESTYLSHEGLVEQLDSMDSSPENYWTRSLPSIKHNIRRLPLWEELQLVGGQAGEINEM